jgi:hypothetical protein
MAFKRNLTRVFASTHQSLRPNLLVSGCSYTWNNSLEHTVTWPNYLRDIANYSRVIDCSQSAAGNAHIFNSIIYELESNPDLTAGNTDIIVMWSGLERTDILATDNLVQQWFHMDHMTFSEGRFASLSVWPDASWHHDRNSDLNKFLKTYRVLIDHRAQILESILKILALHGYLRARGFNPVFTTYRPMQPQLHGLEEDLISSQVLNLLADIEDLDSFTTRCGSRIPNDGHPTPDSHLAWARQVLIPFLTNQLITVK